MHLKHHLVKKYHLGEFGLPPPKPQQRRLPLSGRRPLPEPRQDAGKAGDGRYRRLGIHDFTVMPEGFCRGSVAGMTKSGVLQLSRLSVKIYPFLFYDHWPFQHPGVMPSSKAS